MIPFVGIDASLANVGVCAGEFSGPDICIHDIDLIETKKTKNKQVRASSDTITRCQAIHKFVMAFIEKHNPKFIFVETPSGSQNSSSMKSYGAVCMLIGSFPIPAIQVTPTEIKVASVGNKKASKREMIEWAHRNYPNLPWRMYRGNLQDKNEHMADSIATVYAGMKTDEFQRALRLITL